MAIRFSNPLPQDCSSLACRVVRRRRRVLKNYYVRNIPQNILLLWLWLCYVEIDRVTFGEVASSARWRQTQEAVQLPGEEKLALVHDIAPLDLVGCGRGPPTCPSPAAG